MKIIRFVSISMLLLIALAGCADQSAAIDMFSVDDFDFSLDFGIIGKNNIDTYNGTLTKDLVDAGSETIDFVIPDDVKREIFEAFFEYRISELPDDVSSRGYISPPERFTLTYTLGEETRTIECRNIDEQKGNAKHKRMVEFAQLIVIHECIKYSTNA